MKTLEARAAEKRFMLAFARENDMSVDVCRAQLRSLWTAYCLHYDLDVDTSGYDSEMCDLWDAVEQDWSSHNAFDNFMCQDLV